MIENSEAEQLDVLQAHIVELEAEIATVRQEKAVSQLDLEHAQLATIIEQLPSGLAIAEAPSGKLVLHNAEAVRLLRHPMRDVDSYNGYTQYGAYHSDNTPYKPDEYPIARALWGELIYQEEMHYQRGDGTWTILSVNAAPIHNAAGEIVAAVSTFHDISEHKNNEAALLAAQAQLAEASKLKDLFISIASHDLRTPLTAIKGYLQMLQSSTAKLADNNELSQTLQKTLDMNLRVSQNALRQIGRMEEMINSLLDLPRIQSGQLNLNCVSSVNLVELIKEAVEQHSLNSPNHNLKFETSETEICVTCDPSRIAQVLDNLISNAIKYSPAASPVTISLKTQPARPQSVDAAIPAAPAVIVAVADNGIGISEEEQQHIFDLFYRVQNQQTQQIKGLGLGLYISSEIIALHGGKLWVESRPGAGSTFYFSLPRCPSPLA